MLLYVSSSAPLMCKGMETHRPRATRDCLARLRGDRSLSFEYEEGLTMLVIVETVHAERPVY